MAKSRTFSLPNGWIEVICGPMFAGKSEELIRKLKRLEYAEVNYLIFKPHIDTRTKNEIESRAGLKKSAISIDNPSEILDYLLENKQIKYNVIAIDEAQFFDETLVSVCDFLANHGFIVFVAGLDRDFKGKPFGPIPELLTYADYIHKLTAICLKCGAPASMTQRLIDGKPADYNDDIVVIGNNERYSPRCRHCHVVPNKPYSDVQKKFKKEFKKEFHN